uniref:Uncharacterized protein n=1 Tax=Anguilla anguilla TaxID=7936 RepID=A0A0E9XVQ4_ANGAN
MDGVYSMRSLAVE